MAIHRSFFISLLLVVAVATENVQVSMQGTRALFLFFVFFLDIMAVRLKLLMTGIVKTVCESSG